MAKLTLNDITSGHGSAELYNSNNTAIEAALENTLSLDGTSPNQMQADLDMNGYAILNAAGWATDWNVRGNWATATAYAVGDVVYVPVGTGSSYDGYSLYAQTAHTSGTLDTDFSSGYWIVVAARGAAGATGAGSGDLLAANNLSDVDNLATAFNNLLTGHGQLETTDIGDKAITAAKISDSTAGGLFTWDAGGVSQVLVPGTAGYVLTSNGAGASPSWQASTSTAASQAEMEAATSTTTVVTPGRAHFHPGAAKAWAVMSGSTTLAASYNISSVSTTGTGFYKFTFTTPMSSANYAVMATNISGTTSHNANTYARNTTDFTIESMQINTNSNIDTLYAVVVYGDM